MSPIQTRWSISCPIYYYWCCLAKIFGGTHYVCWRQCSLGKIFLIAQLAETESVVRKCFTQFTMTYSLGPTTNFETMILKFHELLNDLIVSDASDGEKPISSKQIAKIVLFNWSKQVWFGFIVLELVVGSVELWTLLFTIFFSNLEACKSNICICILRRPQNLVQSSSMF